MGLLDSAIADGGRLVGGGGRPEGLDTGYYVAPAIVTGVVQSRIAREGIFACVLVVLTYRDESEAIAIANDTEFGLNDAVDSADNGRALRIARKWKAEASASTTVRRSMSVFRLVESSNPDTVVNSGPKGLTIILNRTRST